jgi:hypothetical protein
MRNYVEGRRGGLKEDPSTYTNGQEQALRHDLRTGQNRVMVGLGRFELPTHGLGNRCSIHLSYSPAPPL